MTEPSRLFASLALLLLGAVWARAEGAGPILDCEPRGTARPICGFQNPEDLAALPDGHHVLVSEYAGLHGEGSGRIALLDLRTESRSVLFEAGNPAGPKATWGDPGCPGPPAALAPHGIDLARRADGHLQLLVVQHHARESVEFFEVLARNSSWAVEWRGCAEAPPGSWLNDVVALSDGSFLVTHMRPRAPVEDLTASYDSEQRVPGQVLAWNRSDGFHTLAGFDHPVPNGIELSPDETTVFLNVDGATLRIVRATGEVTGRVPAAITDNLTWAPDGRLLVAVLLGRASDFDPCLHLEAGACPVAFQIVALHPDTLASEVLYRNEGPPMGAGTVGLQVGDELLVGSFAGDRILRVKLAND